MADRDPDTIKQDIDQARDQLASTVDSLAERANPRRIADDVKSGVVRFVKKPPVAISLAGAGGVARRALRPQDQALMSRESAATPVRSQSEKEKRGGLALRPSRLQLWMSTPRCAATSLKEYALDEPLVGDAPVVDIS